MKLNFISGYDALQFIEEKIASKKTYVISGIDNGAKKIGLARFISVTGNVVPYGALYNNNEVSQKITHFIKESMPICCVIGVWCPNDDNTDNTVRLHSKISWKQLPEMTKKLLCDMQKLSCDAEELNALYSSTENLYTMNKQHHDSINVTFFDESMTTVLANHKLKDVGLCRKKRILLDDQIAAMELLERFVSFFKLRSKV
ncbi:Putative Holliday junction resolvase [Candidatus Fokinia solitaria]|uniref:Holliday junction resolvase n=1 Tax=Candidatus Fokinia solitaria TaxID=1802984 RepID=A0A2U8BRS6_9RICK|nr:Holliday junction resolvase RuvX [Candidatus Fokinia solitaria]AWD33039.1 Putative Holliday junction resolvase [Candidatus Fokinia solitaria]